ncbi:uncharacterized protein LOC116778386 [Danaus plexippus]|uniref:uncharacterized protein LOC116778386 n=1 Tax=Danaus plexippus TaxID=13037 RepID=UPI002AB0F26F|nr:uncharacterized protein LOC116778386 [Danaus plexippus]
MNILFVLSLIYLSVSCKYSCDYKFGDPSWDYSQIFYNKSHIVTPGTNELMLHLESELMVSFVCVNVSVAKESSDVSYSSLFKKLTIKLREAQEKDVRVDVVAMHHGYRRRDY